MHTRFFFEIRVLGMLRETKQDPWCSALPRPDERPNHCGAGAQSRRRAAPQSAGRAIIARIIHGGGWLWALALAARRANPSRKARPAFRDQPSRGRMDDGCDGRVQDSAQVRTKQKRGRGGQEVRAMMPRLWALWQDQDSGSR